MARRTQKQQHDVVWEFYHRIGKLGVATLHAKLRAGEVKPLDERTLDERIEKVLLPNANT